MAIRIDLNCDMGEGFQTDELIMPFISSANIACGYHAGDSETIKETIQLAQKYGVAIGAHPSYPDKAGFGRRAMEMNINELHKIIVEQINLVKTIADSLGQQLKHIKPHGALYNASAINYSIASIIATAIKSTDPSLKLFGMPNTASERAANNEGIAFCREVFCDRSYTDEGMLTPRAASNALINASDQALLQVLQVIKENTVTSTSGKKISMEVDTLCIHGDGLYAVEFVNTIRAGLEKENITIAACT